MASTRELYDSVTNRIVAELENGVIPWTRPWAMSKKNTMGFIPYNAATGRPYSGVNILILWATANERACSTNGWMTFRQANEIGARVRKGEKATTVVFTKWTEDTEDGKVKKRSMLKSYSVFNLSQLDALPDSYTEPPEPGTFTTAYNEAQDIIDHCGIPIRHGGNKACYSPDHDVVAIPPHSAFESDEEYYGVAFHELSHGTAHKTRLDRSLKGKFGDASYCFEELIAELSSAFLCAHTGIPARHRSASYVQNWLTGLKEDNRAIFRAASYASQAADWLREQVHAVQPETPDIERSLVSAK